MKYYNITVNGVAYSVSVEETAAGAAPVAAAAPAAPKAPAAPAAAPKAAAPAPAAAPKAAAGAAGAVTVKAPMPGNILDVKVKVGDTVKQGDALATLHLNRMEMAEDAIARMQQAVRLTSEKPATPPLVYAAVSPEGVAR